MEHILKTSDINIGWNSGWENDWGSIKEKLEKKVEENCNLEIDAILRDLYPEYPVKDFKEKVKMTTQIEWTKQQTKAIYFEDLEVGQHFSIDTPGSKGAVYRKIKFSNAYGDTYYQLEVATASIFDSTKSPVKLVDVKISINAEKPNISGY